MHQGQRRREKRCGAPGKARQDPQYLHTQREGLVPWRSGLSRQLLLMAWEQQRSPECLRDTAGAAAPGWNCASPLHGLWVSGVHGRPLPHSCSLSLSLSPCNSVSQLSKSPKGKNKTHLPTDGPPPVSPCRGGTCVFETPGTASEDSRAPAAGRPKAERGQGEDTCQFPGPSRH